MLALVGSARAQVLQHKLTASDDAGSGARSLDARRYLRPQDCNVTGQAVPAGSHEAELDGGRLASGMYLVCLETAGVVRATQKVLLLRCHISLVNHF